MLGILTCTFYTMLMSSSIELRKFWFVALSNSINSRAFDGTFYRESRLDR